MSAHEAVVGSTVIQPLASWLTEVNRITSNIETIDLGVRSPSDKG